MTPDARTFELHDEQETAKVSSVDEPGTGPAESPPAAQAHEEKAEERSRAKPLLALAFTGLIALSGVLGYLYWDTSRGERALAQAETLRIQAVSDASTYAELMGSYTYTDLEQSFSDVIAVSTPEFAEEYETVANELRDAVTESRGVSQGSAIHAAVQSVDENQATVLVFLNQEVTNVLRPEGGIEASRLVVSLERDGDRWLLSDVQPM
ncbi:hypothetical protein [Hoyosella subflava]|uniref:Mce-associated membrane protein n=1 Tax=Hoyosella subflava (strain DSM 45089 / JCM 17490 / NBRC 109087 / DQS3-9A1) TaxID=443218 RepID=F6EHS7_HOYSD|nr:hypothetical protein [Hoyosella subflava]AEF38875.1 hypothetical protein AS9A_0418 [Hoyosella subflava DQS3-9A1]